MRRTSGRKYIHWEKIENTSLFLTENYYKIILIFLALGEEWQDFFFQFADQGLVGL